MGGKCVCVCVQRQVLLVFHVNPLWFVGLYFGLSWKKALAVWHTKAVADIESRECYKAKAIGISPNASRANCDISPVVFIWFNDLASSQFLSWSLFSFSWAAFYPSHPLQFFLQRHFFNRNRKGGTQNWRSLWWWPSKLLGQFLGFPLKQSVGCPEVLEHSACEIIAPGICEFLF